MTIPPTFEELQHYCLSRRNGIDPEYFMAFYNANGWVQGSKGKPIKDWKACVVTWEKRQKKAFGANKILNNLQDRSWAE
jgi:hypothetical protein